MATIDDVVKVSGYSRSTVFRLLAGKAVRPAAREAIAEAMRTTGYAAGGLDIAAPREDAALVLSVPAGLDGFRGYADATGGVMRRAAELGVPVLFDAAQAAGRRYAVLSLGKGMEAERAEERACRDAGVPLVFINRRYEDGHSSWASADFRLAGTIALERLAAAGCRRIGCWADAEDRLVERQKLDGIREAAAARGLEVDVRGPADGDVERVALTALAREDRPDGWIGLSDEAAMRVVRVAATLGLRVPRRLSVVGMNDVESAAYFAPALTSVRIPFSDCGAAAVDAALRLLDRPSEAYVRILLRPRLAERESCAPAAGAATMN